MKNNLIILLIIIFIVEGDYCLLNKKITSYKIDINHEDKNSGDLYYNNKNYDSANDYLEKTINEKSKKRKKIHKMLKNTFIDLYHGNIDTNNKKDNYINNDLVPIY